MKERRLTSGLCYFAACRESPIFLAPAPTRVVASTANKRLPIRVIAPASPSDGVCKNACHAYAIAAPPARLSRWIERQPVRFDQIKVGTTANT